MKIRQGKDIVLRWKVLTNGQDVSLGGRNITLVMTTPLGREKIVEHEVEGSVVKAHLLGKTLMQLGDYTLTLWENRGEEGQTAVDAVNAFTLVQYSTQEDNGSPCGNLEYEVAELATANMDVITSNEVVIESVEVVDNLESDATDKALSARQGKELKGMIPTKVSELENDEGYITEIPEGYATKEDVSEAVSGKQDALTLTVKDNGNIVIGNISGQSKEFMPATPSGDPMHYAYLAAGAEWNDTDSVIEKTAPWGTEETWVKNEDGTYTYTEKVATVQHLPKHYYLNGLGDITANEMSCIYEYGKPIPAITALFADSPIRTTFSHNVSGLDGYGSFNISGMCADCLKMESLFISRSTLVRSYGVATAGSGINFLRGCLNLRHIQKMELTSITPYYGQKLTDLSELRSFYFRRIQVNVNIKGSPYVYKRSIIFLINNATPTSVITITLHPDAYARLAEDADIVAALEAKPLVTLVSA